jgi:hypothetical protein
MIIRDIWQEDGDIEEAPSIASRVTKDLWNQGVAKGYLSLYGHNNDEMYAYTIYASLEGPEGISELVKGLVARAPGSLKEITVRLLTTRDKDLLGPSESYRPLPEFRSEVATTDEGVKRMVLEQLPTSFKDKVSAGKELAVEYDVRVTFLILSQGSRIVLDTFGPLIPEEEARALTFAKELGEVKGYTISQVREVKVVNIEEEPNSIFAFVIVNPSRKE